jgi:hypothetical protein
VVGGADSPATIQISPASLISPIVIFARVDADRDSERLPMRRPLGRNAHAHPAPKSGWAAYPARAGARDVAFTFMREDLGFDVGHDHTLIVTPAISSGIWPVFIEKKCNAVLNGIHKQFRRCSTCPPITQPWAALGVVWA